MANTFRGKGCERTSLIIASHLEGEGHFRSERFTVEPVLCREGGDWDYWHGLAKHWDSDRVLINLEHDVDATDDHIAALLDCPHPACSFAYACHWQSSGRPEDVIAAGTGSWERHLQGGEPWADWSAIGLVKLTPQARVAPLECARWQQLEMSVHRAVKPPWHMHWESDGTGVTHHHW